MRTGQRAGLQKNTDEEGTHGSRDQGGGEERGRLGRDDEQRAEQQAESERLKHAAEELSDWARRTDRGRRVRAFAKTVTGALEIVKLEGLGISTGTNQRVVHTSTDHLIKLSGELRSPLVSELILAVGLTVLGAPDREGVAEADPEAPTSHRAKLGRQTKFMFAPVFTPGAPRSSPIAARALPGREVAVSRR